MSSFFKIFMSVLLCGVFGAGPGAGAFADEPVSTPWQQHGEVLKTRLVRTENPIEPGEILYAWEAELEEGWKTYWRSPGEAGLPVRLFSGEDEIEIFYPLPTRFELFGMETYGYGKHVMLPFSFDGSADEIKADFMVCKEICIPYKASYSLKDGGESDSLASIRLKPWLIKVPHRTGDAGVGLKVISAKVSGPVGRQRLIVDVEADKNLSGADLLIEADGPYRFSQPKVKLLGSGNRARMVIMVKTGKMKADLKGNDVRLTLSDGSGHAIDRTITAGN